MSNLNTTTGADKTWPELDKPALVGATTFSKGVNARTVVLAAQRQYEYQCSQNPGKYDGEAFRKALERVRDSILAPASGFEDDDIAEVCRHAHHNPPEHMVIPSGKRYRHVCPGCGNTILIRSSYSNMGML